MEGGKGTKPHRRALPAAPRSAGALIGRRWLEMVAPDWPVATKYPNAAGAPHELVPAIRHSRRGTDLSVPLRLALGVIPRRRHPCFFPPFRPSALPIELTGGCFSHGLCWPPPSARPPERSIDQNPQPCTDCAPLIKTSSGSEALETPFWRPWVKVRPAGCCGIPDGALSCVPSPTNRRTGAHGQAN